MTYQKWTVLFLLFVSFSAVLVSVTGTAHAQSPQSIVPTITLASHPCNPIEPDPDCLVGVTTSVRFKIHFSSSIDADTFTSEDIISSDIDGGTMAKDFGQFIYHVDVPTDRTVTIQIPADAVSDTSDNTNSAAQITVRIDHHNPTIMIPEEYLDAHDGYTQAVQIKQPYEEPNITCVDKVYEGVTDDGDKIFDRDDNYDAVPNINVTTAFEPEDLPKLFYVRYNCTDAGHRTYSEHLSVMLVKDLSVFNTPPALLKIERSSPHSENTDSQTLTYNVFFSKNVVGIDESDFVLSPHSTGVGNNATHPVTDVSPVTDRAYSVTISAATDGTYNLDLISSGHGITDIMRKPLTSTVPTGVDQTYTVSTTVADTANPRLASIERYNPTSQNTDSQSLVYKATFSESVTGVTVSDFTLSPDSTGGGNNGNSPVTGISGSGSVYYVTVSSSTDGTYNLDLVSSGHNIEDGADNPLTNTAATGADQTYTVSITVADTANPRLASIERYNPTSQNTDSQSLVYKATFSESVTGVTVSDFTLSPDSTGGGNNGNSPVTGISGSGSVYYVTVSSSTDGTYNLDLVSSGHNIEDGADNPLTNTAATGADQTYTVSITVADTTNPRLASIERYNPTSQNTDSQSLVYKATFSESVTGVTVSDFTLSPDSTGGGNNGNSTVTGISGSGSVYYVTVSSSTDGTYNLDLVSSGHNIEDGADNPLTNTAATGADQTYTVSITVADTANPRLASIERYSPTSQNTDSQSLVYKATFSESVTGVTVSDFTLSPDSTGGGNNGNSTVTGISGSGSVYYVTVSSSTDGTYNLDLVSSGHNIEDGADNPLTNTAATGADQTYTVSITVADTANPRLASIERYSPTSQNTDSQSLVYKATFSESVTGVTVSDFTLSPDSTGGGNNGNSTVTGISGSGSVYYVTVSSSTDGTYNLDLVSSGHNIEDGADNPLTNTAATGADQTYTVSITVADTANPRLASIERYNPTSQNTDSQSLVYKATFSESVTGVTVSDFTLSPDSTGSGNNGNSTVTGISGSGSVYYVTVSSSTDGTYNLDLVSSGHNIEDGADNPLTNTAATGADQTYTVSITVADTANPRLASIERYSPTSQNTDSQSLVYKATFSENVTGVTVSDFTLSPDSTGSGNNGNSTVTGISGSGSVYYVTVSSSTDGTYNLDLVSSGHNIEDGADNPLTNTAATGADQTYTVSITVADTTNPRLASIERYSPTSQNTDSQSLIYKATFSENVTGVTVSDFTLSPDSTGGGNNGNSTVTGISGSGSVYYVTVSSSTDGTYNLDLVSSGHNIEDGADNPLTNTAATGADQTYTVSTTVADTTNPRLASIERYSPTSQNTDNQSLIYKATFSESVTGVTVSDFTLSPDSTGGGGTFTSSTTTTGQFTQTRSPNLAIPYNVTVSDAITVSNSGTATSVSVTLGITHTYIGDLKVDLVAPDGTARTLHNYSDGSADDIDKTYAPSFGSVPISGVWTLRINDKFDADSGVLNSWTLTINYGTDTTTTVSPVTGISGSGSVYYVIVSSSTDGTYNLDLVSSGHNIEDGADNPLTNTAATGADQTYTVSTTVADTTNPRLASIERYSPTSQNTDSQSLIYMATFSESVTGVTVSDFTLSPGSTGGGGTSTSSTTTTTGQFTQTRSPNPAIPYDVTVSNAITATVSPVTGISGSGSVYYVIVSSSTDGTYNLDLVSSGNNIEDGADNPLTNTAATGADQTYTVSTTVADTTNPRLASIERYSPTSQNTDSQSLIYKATFSESVTGVTASDFTLSPGSTGSGNNGNSPVTGISGSGSVYHVTVSSSTDGTYNLDLASSGHNIEDGADNPLTNTAATGADQTYTVSTTVADTTNPRLASIEWYSPTSQNTDSRSLIYKATFNESVTGVTASDFTLSPGSTGGGDTSTSSTTTTGQFTQTRSPNLVIPYNVTVSDAITVSNSGTATSVSVTLGITHTYIGDLKVDLVAPDGTARTLHNYSDGSADDIDKTYAPSFGSVPISGVWTLRINDKFDADSGVLNSWTLTINYGTDATTTVSPVIGISGSGSVYYVIVSSSTDGTYNLDLASSGHNIEDGADNPLTNTAATGADQTYTVSTTVADTTNPRLASIEWYSPTSQNTDSRSLIYKATFNESVTGVTASDFTLSPGSTGGGDTSTSSTTTTGQFTQTRSPNLAIPYDVTVSDAITVSNSGTATSVSVTLGITHTYIGDLKVDLVAPDGTARTLHNYSDGSADDIDKTYAPSFGSVPISGVWTLRINDNYNADSGVLNSWTLTINYGTDATTTVSPVTGISGSGSVYYVTVSSSTDGTYNLDLVSSGHNIEDGADNPLTNMAATVADQTYTVSTTVADTTNPRLASIERYSPTSQNTDSQSMIYKATFSESITGVTASDFTLSPNSTGSGNNGNSPVTGISGSGSVYYVIVSSSTDGTYNLDLISSGHNIEDGADNSMTNTAATGADQTYTVSTTVADTTNPRLASIERHSPTSQNTDSQYLIYKATFSESVTGVTASDFTLSPNSTGSGNNGNSPVTGISGSGSVYYVIVSSSTDGTYNLDLVSSGHNIEDGADNSMTNTAATGADQTYTVSTTVADTTNPRLASIERHSPTSQNTDSQYLIYKATFSESVTGVTASDFTLSPNSTGSGNNGNSPVTGISGSGSVYYVIVSSSTDGTYNLDLISSGHNIEDDADNSMTNTAATGPDQTYTVSTVITDATTPRLLSIERYSLSSATTNSRTLMYEVAFSEDVTGVDKADFVLSPDSTGDTGNNSNRVAYVNDSDSVYIVIVIAFSDGTYNLDLVSSGHGIADTDNNPLTDTAPTTGTDETHTYSAAS